MNNAVSTVLCSALRAISICSFPQLKKFDVYQSQNQVFAWQRHNVFKRRECLNYQKFRLYGNFHPKSMLEDAATDAVSYENK